MTHRCNAVTVKNNGGLITYCGDGANYYFMEDRFNGVHHYQDLFAHCKKHRGRGIQPDKIEIPKEDYEKKLDENETRQLLEL